MDLLVFELLLFLKATNVIVGKLLEPFGTFVVCQFEILFDAPDFLGNPAENFLATANRMTEDTDPLQASFIDVGINRARRHKVHDADGFALLAVAVDTTDALFNAHRIPRQIVVHAEIAGLEVQTFAAYFGRQQNIQCIRIIPWQREAFAQGRPFIIGNAAMNQAVTQASGFGVASEV